MPKGFVIDHFSRSFTSSRCRAMTDEPYVSRVNQIDAGQLDEEIYKILKMQTYELTKLCPQDKVEAWQPEIDAFLKSAIWWFSLGSGESTFGQRLLDLKYAKLGRWRAFFFLVLDVAPVYLGTKFANGGRTEGRARLSRWLGTTANLFRLLGFLNLLAFLRNGKQPSLAERILGVSSVSTSTDGPRRIGYSYMTRELLWHGLVELFAVGLPMINFHAAKQTILRLWTRRREGRIALRKQPCMDRRTRCPYCDENPILPTYADCEHLYCYYCMRAHFAATDSFRCLACDTELHSTSLRAYEPGSVELGIQGSES